MLIEFSVANFRSFRDRQTLSMVAAPRLGKKENTFAPDLAETFPDLLKAVAIYGPNATGKSNLLRALDVIPHLANSEPTPNPGPLPVVPFRFDPSSADKPSAFELHFVRFGLRYSYELAATSSRVVSERLVAFPNGKESLIYERRYTGTKETYTFGPSLTAEASAEVTDAWKKLTPPTALFVARAVANSSADMRVLRAPFEWLAGSTLSLMKGMKGMASLAQDLIREGLGADEISSFLSELDIPVATVTVEPVDDVQLSSLMVLGAPRRPPSTELFAAMPTARRHKTRLTHRTAFGESDIAFEDESEGTKNLFGFWLPWVSKDFDREDARCLLAIDEIDSSLHPKIVEALVAKHQRAAAPSQLIFTTHDTHLMDSKLLRRDQIWITERDANGATQLRSIHDFKGRQSEDIEKRYYEGRYRGLPLTTNR